MIKKGQGVVFAFALAYTLFFCVFYLMQKNYEFIVYLGVVMGIIWLILATNEKVNYRNDILWGLTIWGFLHLSGGAFSIGGVRLYDYILVPISSTLSILRFDQVLHMYGYGLTTYILFFVLKPSLKPKVRHWASLSIIIVLAGTGAGVINEIIEFITSLAMHSHGVGGYINNSIDLISNFVGAVVAMVIIYLSESA